MSYLYSKTMRQHEAVSLQRLYRNSDDGPSSISLSLRWHVRSSSRLPAYESPCSHVNIRLTTSTPYVWNAALLAPWVYQHLGVLLSRVDNMQKRCMLDPSCILGWIKSDGTKKGLMQSWCGGESCYRQWWSISSARLGPHLIWCQRWARWNVQIAR